VWGSRVKYWTAIILWTTLSYSFPFRFLLLHCSSLSFCVLLSLHFTYKLQFNFPLQIHIQVSQTFLDFDSPSHKSQIQVLMLSQFKLTPLCYHFFFLGIFQEPHLEPTQSLIISSFWFLDNRKRCFFFFSLSKISNILLYNM